MIVNQQPNWKIIDRPNLLLAKNFLQVKRNDSNTIEKYYSHVNHEVNKFVNRHSVHYHKLKRNTSFDNLVNSGMTENGINQTESELVKLKFSRYISSVETIFIVYEGCILVMVLAIFVIGYFKLRTYENRKG